MTQLKPMLEGGVLYPSRNITRKVTLLSKMKKIEYITDYTHTVL